MTLTTCFPVTAWKLSPELNIDQFSQGCQRCIFVSEVQRPWQEGEHSNAASQIGSERVILMVISLSIIAKVTNQLTVSPMFCTHCNKNAYVDVPQTITRKWGCFHMDTAFEKKIKKCFASVENAYFK